MTILRILGIFLIDKEFMSKMRRWKRERDQNIISHSEFEKNKCDLLRQRHTCNVFKNHCVREGLEAVYITDISNNKVCSKCRLAGHRENQCVELAEAKPPVQKKRRSATERQYVPVATKNSDYRNFFEQVLPQMKNSAADDSYVFVLQSIHTKWNSLTPEEKKAWIYEKQTEIISDSTSVVRAILGSNHPIEKLIAASAQTNK